MELNLLEAIVYGFVSGITEFMPVSSQAHQLILRNLFGISEANPLLSMFVHMGMLTGLLTTSGGLILKLYNEYRHSKASRRRRKREVNLQAVHDISFVKTACIPMLLSFFIYAKTMGWGSNIPLVALFLVLNGLILFIPMYLARGNKESRNMTGVDSIVFGICSALSVLPGVSRVGAGCSAAIALGADPQHAYKWSLLLSIPVLAVLFCFDVVSIFTAGVAGIGISYLVNCILCGVFTHLGASLSIALLRSVTLRSGIGGFSYYSWGAALFAFILYLY